jgi:uncharacterized membrane protein
MQSEKLQGRIDAYLAELRRCLGELPPQEVNEILREIRGHIFERAEASGELTEDRVVAILKALGRPDEIAPLYRVDSVVARARGSFSPRVVMRGIHRWSMVSLWGLVLFVLGIVGYATGFALILAGFLKIIAPSQIGAWVGPHAVFDIGVWSRWAWRAGRRWSWRRCASCGGRCASREFGDRPSAARAPKPAIRNPSTSRETPERSALECAWKIRRDPCAT